VEDNKTRFLADEFFSLVIQATLQRSQTYDQNATDTGKDAFKDELRSLLESISESYKDKVSEDEHIKNIDRISAELSEKHAATLENGRFRIGSAQKALNLHLKYLWCLGIICEPPHCPFDSIIIKELPSSVAVNWTELDDLGKYQSLVAEAMKLSGDQSLATWELVKYNKA
jgi:hypothetical protein